MTKINQHTQYTQYIQNQKLTVPIGVSLVLENCNLENVLEIELLENSNLKISLKPTQANLLENISTLQITQHKNTCFQATKILQNNYENHWNITLNGDNTTTKIYTLILGKNQNQFKLDEKITSLSTNNQITHLTKTVLDDQSCAIIYHTAVIPFGTLDHQTNQKIQTILLSQKSKVEMRPILQISSPSVKANHGATVGKFDPNQLVYLQSRGFNLTNAKKLLQDVFCDEILNKL